MMVVRFFVPVLAAIVALYSHCAQFAGGAGGETTNGMVTGALTDSSGAYCPGALVRLFPATYDPVKDTVDIQVDATGSDGNYTFSRVPRGDYTLQAVRTENGTRAMISGVRVGNGPCFAPTRKLLRPGSIQVALPSGSLGSGAYVYIPGSAHVVFLDNQTDFVVLDSVPADTIPAVSYSSTSTVGSTVIRYDIVVKPSDTAVIENPSWNHARRLVLNTTATGADVSGDLVDFPVLVRLDRDNFNFSGALANGTDLRFVNADNIFLPFEIVQWNPVAQRAEVWVRVDTIHGNDSLQFVTMLWGASTNPAVGPWSNGAAVFGTDNGFIGVWHLDTAGTDATGNGHDGTNFGAVDTDGIIGNAKKFNGQDSIRIAGLLGTPASLTLSGWVEVDTTIASGQEVVSIGDAVLIRADETVNGYGTSGYAHRYTRNGDTSFTKVFSGLNIAKTGWRYITFAFDNQAHVHTLYLDGLPVIVDTSSYAIDYTGVGSTTFIGAHGNNKHGYNCRSCIDEVRACGVVRSADWIKMCYMNQRSNDRLVEFK